MTDRSHDDLLAPAERGCLVIGDVTGYSQYLQEVELEHARDVLADLTETVVRSLTPTLRLAKLEGDAAFAYAPEAEIEASMLLDAVDQTYFAFRSRVRDIDQVTSCDCNACLLIPELNLKIVVHHGRYVLQRVAGHEELAGSDVILVHRLLKNRVADRLGLAGYALFTEPCIEALGVDPAALDMVEHRETYQDVGEVAGWVENLEARWRYEEERRRVYVTPAEAELETVEVFPGPPELVWEYLTSPQKRLLWQKDVTGIDEESPGGRRGAGTTNHCMHGKTAVIQEILDWRPFRYFTMRSKVPVLGWWTWTHELRPTEDGHTEVRARGERLRGPRRRLAWLALRRPFRKSFREEDERLRELLAGQVETAAV